MPLQNPGAPSSFSFEGFVASWVFGAAVLSLVFGVAAVATSEWHYTSSPTDGRTDRGLFRVCRVEMVEGVAKHRCAAHPTTAYCDGHTDGGQRHRVAWAPAMAVLSLLLAAAVPLVVVLSWLQYTPRPWPTLALVVGAVVCMAGAVTLFFDTMDSWHFCDREYCEFRMAAFGLNATSVEALSCSSGVGYSFFLCVAYLMCLFVAAIASGWYARWVRLGYIATEPPSVASQPCREPPTSDPFAAASCEEVVGRASPGSAAAGGRPGQQPGGAMAHTTTTLDGNHTNNGVDHLATSGRDGAAATVPAGDDWVYDAARCMYWSDAHLLFHDAKRNRYYDPAADMWYDPISDDWTTEAPAGDATLAPYH